MANMGQLNANFQMDQQMLNYLKNKTTKLSAKEVFEKINSAVGLITVNQNIKKCGVFVEMKERAYFVTTINGLPEDSEGIEVYHSSGKYTVREHPELNTEKVNDTQLKVFECYGLISPKISFLKLTPPDIRPIRAGVKVYFAGNPLSSKGIIFHRGTISGGCHIAGNHFFTIDGTVVKGFSGGPVAIQHEGLVYLAGIIRSQMVTQIISPSCEDNDDANLSTGIGNAIDAYHCCQLINWENMPEPISRIVQLLDGIPLGEDFVGKGKRKLSPVPVQARNGKTFYVQHDGHGTDHLLKKSMTTKQIQNSTLDGKALFLPKFANFKSYDGLVEKYLKEWIDAGADEANMVIDTKELIGYANGRKAYHVQVYTSDIGSHIRPIDK